MASAHLLTRAGEALYGEKLKPFFKTDLPAPRLSALARLVAVCRDKSLIHPLEKLIRSLMETVAGQEEMEAFTNLINALISLDKGLGNRVAAVADSTFVTSRSGFTNANFFPWCSMFDSIYLQDKDYQAMLSVGGNDASAAVYRLTAYGGGRIFTADKGYPTKLDDASMQQLRKMAEEEKELIWQYKFALASIEVHAFDLLPCVIKVASTSEISDNQDNLYHLRFGRITEPCLSNILRAIGYLARLLLDEKRGEEAAPGVAHLRERYAAVAPDENRSVVVGLTTGLGYLGDWDPILTHLGPGEPWMHEAAFNIFKHWFPTPLDKASSEEQLEKAARWIARRLRDFPFLPPEVRSTLERCKDTLETKLGRHVLPGEIK